MFKIDLNSDLGEGFGAYKAGLDDRIIPLITSANIACGFHAGDRKPLSYANLTAFVPGHIRVFPILSASDAETSMHRPMRSKQ